jgi:hypothetical protein
MNKSDKETLLKQSAFMNRWMQEKIFAAKPTRKRELKRKPCPYCGEPIGLTKPCCYKCFAADERRR